MTLSRLERSLLTASRGPFLSPPGDDAGGGGNSSSDNANSGGQREGSEGGKGGEGKEGESAKGGEGKEGEAAAAKPVAIVVDGKTYLLQDEANRLIGSARQDGKNAGKTEAEQAAALKLARDTGDLQGVITGLETRIGELEADIAKRDRTDLRATVAVAAGLVGDHADLVDLIVGETEEEMKASAKKLADRVLPKKAVDTEAGAGANKRTSGTGKQGGDSNGKQGGGGSGAGDNGSQGTPSHSWVPAGAVSIPDDQ